jgi:ACS family sodium-dependent inorganic phosphate cotransporter
MFWCTSSSVPVVCDSHSLFLHLVHVPVCRGYLLTQVLGGVWADKFGGKRVLSFGVIWWSMATALTPLAASLGLPVLLVMRACMGVGEGVAMPAMNNLLSR